MKLVLWDADERAAVLSFENDRWSLAYDRVWLESPRGIALSPALSPQQVTSMRPEASSATIEAFLRNWLPEGRALDVAAKTVGVSKSSLAGLLLALGRDLAGAFLVTMEGSDIAGLGASTPLRPISRKELSTRIRSRQDEPFSVWDGRARLSIAGYQDKLAVLQRAGDWFLADDPDLASTHILKPDPVAKALAGMTTNEFFCLRLAAACGFPVARTTLHQVPEPVLGIERFDRIVSRDGRRVSRIACIDGCQALGLSVEHKYERPFGNQRDVAGIRDGASLARFFSLARSRYTEHPAQMQLGLLRWAIFQYLIGNTDAHAKNITFFSMGAGLRLAPMYDLVSGLAFVGDGVEDSLAMAIGDTFDPRAIRAYDWAQMAHEAALPPTLVGAELARLARRLQVQAPLVARTVAQGGAVQPMVERVMDVVLRQSSQALVDAPLIRQVSTDLFGVASHTRAS